jgi:hypothetical protein
MKHFFIFLFLTTYIFSFDYLKIPNVIQVNQITSFIEEYPRICSLTNGNFIIAWHASTIQTGVCPGSCFYNIYFNIYDPTGNRLTNTAITVNTPNTYKASFPWVVSDGNGGFVISWELTDLSTFNDIYIRKYDSKLNPSPINKLNVTAGTITATSTALNSIDRLKSGNYIVFWWNDYQTYGMWAQLLDPNLNKLGNNFPVPDATGNSATQLFANAVALQNGGFLLAWQSSKWNSGIPDISGKIYDPFGLAVTAEFLVNTGVTAGIQTNPRAAVLKNGTIAITWCDLNINGGDIMVAIFKADGTSAVSAFTANTTTTNAQTGPMIAALNFGGFVVVWESLQTANKNIMLQLFQNTGAKIGGEKLVNTNVLFAMSNPFVAEIPQSNQFIVGWQSSGQIYNNDVWAQIFYKDLGVCKDITYYQGKLQFSINLDFSSVPGSNIIVKTLPTVGQLKDMNGAAIVIGNVYTNTGIYYTTIKQGADSFTYSTNTVDPGCNFSYVPCYTSCAACVTSGTATTNNCTQCDNGYYQKLDLKDGNCYSKTDKVNRYYYDDLVKVFQKCYSSCYECNGKGDSTNHNCRICKIDYFPLIDNSANCYQSTEVVTGYLYDNQTKKFLKCYSACQTCNLLGDDNDHLCLTCARDYYPLIDNNNMCYKSDIVLEGYYFDSTSKTFQRCYQTCKHCSGFGDIRSPNCTECAYGLTSCDGCTKNLYKDQCVDECPKTTIYNAANKTCIECTAEEILFNNACITSCPDSYIHDSNTCFTCKSKGMYIYNKLCVKECPSKTTLNTNTNTCEMECNLGYYSDGIGCIYCADKSQLFYENTCVQNCPGYTTQQGGYCQSDIIPTGT